MLKLNKRITTQVAILDILLIGKVCHIRQEETTHSKAGKPFLNKKSLRKTFFILGVVKFKVGLQNFDAYLTHSSGLVQEGINPAAADGRQN